MITTVIIQPRPDIISHSCLTLLKGADYWQQPWGPCLISLSLQMRTRAQGNGRLAWVCKAVSTQVQKMCLFPIHVCLLRSIQNKLAFVKRSNQVRLHDSQGPVQNENVGFLNQTLLRISRRLKQSILTRGAKSDCTGHTPMKLTLIAFISLFTELWLLEGLGEERLSEHWKC